MVFNFGKLLTAGRKVTFKYHSGRNKDVMNSIIFPNVSRLELHSVPFQNHWTMKWVGSCQAHTAVCLFAWGVCWGLRENKVREVRIESSGTPSIKCPFCWSTWIPSWNSYYIAVFTYFSLLLLIFYPSPCQCSNSSVSLWCNYPFGNSRQLLPVENVSWHRTPTCLWIIGGRS